MVCIRRLVRGSAITPCRADRFKLQLRPASIIDGTNDVGTPPVNLPRSKTITDVYADFYRFLFEHARTYIRESLANGDLVWETVKDEITFVLSHPNGWEGVQQNAMRKAAIRAGLIPDLRRGNERIVFVTEGEASLHYCLSKGLLAEVAEVRINRFIVTDAHTVSFLGCQIGWL